MIKKLLLCTVVLGIKISAQCDALDLPYSEDFENVSVPALPSCTTIENAGSGTNWYTNQNTYTGLNTKALTYRYNSNPANAWFFTPGLNLTGGMEYRITYKYSTAGYTENLKVAYGLNADSTSMINELIDHPNITSRNVVYTDNIVFTPSDTGIYYIGFNCYSNPSQFYLKIDDISVISAQLGTKEIDSKNDAVKIYPNPFVDVININKIDNVQSVSVTDISGRLIKTIDKPSSPIDLKDSAPGLYMLKLEMKDGSQKIIKAMKK